MKAIFLRALEEAEDKDRALRAAITTPERAMGQTRFEVDPATFGSVPRSPFAYWVSDKLRNQFQELPRFQVGNRAARIGASTKDDFRFLRLSWETANAFQGAWKPYAKGGNFAPFYRNYTWTLNWRNDGAELKAYADLRTQELFGAPGWSRWINSVDYYFKPGISWPLRGVRFSAQAVPAGCIFGVAGKMAFADAGELPSILALFNSTIFDQFIAFFAGKVGGVQYEVGLIQGMPIPGMEPERQAFAKLSHRAWLLRRSLDSPTENSHAFHLPALLQMDGGQLSDRADAWGQHVADTNAELARLQAEIDDRCFELYGIDGADREQIERGLGGSSAEEDAAATQDDEDEPSEAHEIDAAPLVASLLSWSAGVAFGRFDLRLATGERPAPPEPEPFDPLPVCSPGMLTGEDGLPLDAPPAGYAIDFPRDGILVDDAGTPGDLVASARQVFEHVFDDPAACWEEAAEILGQRDRTLRRWFGRDFFGLHLKQYSKSRRKAPIYWPLSTASGSYTVWLYYPRLTADTLFQVVAEHLVPKLRKTQEERLQVDAAQGRAEGREAAKLAKQAGELAELEQGLEEMKAELLRVAELPYKPNLNDGVQITAAPLAKLFQLKAWRMVLDATWKKLEKGEYDWAHLAHAIWPDRVREKCKTDRSLAIAHGLENLCDAKTTPKKRRRSKGAT